MSALKQSNLYPLHLYEEIKKATSKVQPEECKCRASNGKKCCDTLCPNVKNQIECGKHCGESCKNQKIRGGFKDAYTYKKLVSKEIGLGVYAGQAIKKGNIICEYYGALKTKARYEVDQRKSKTLFGILLDSGYVLDGLEVDSIGRYMNHGCVVNAEIQEWSSDGFPHILVVALRDIKKREQILYDYNLQVDRGQKKFKCKCGKRECTDNSYVKLYDCKPKIPKQKFKCRVCGKEFDVQCRLKQHLLVHLKLHDKPHVCKKCGKKFLIKARLERHKLSHGKKKFECQVCKRKFRRSEYLRAHLLTHDEGSATMQVCRKCGREFASKKELDAHKIKHKRYVLKPYKCGKCPRKFEKALYLTCHLKIHDNVCQICKETFLTKGKLTRHKMKVHSDVKEFMCDICDKRFARQKYLTQHLKLHIMDNVACNYCGKSFNSSRNLNRHSKIHSRRRKQPCSIENVDDETKCTRTYYSPFHERNHFRTRH